MKSIQRSQLIEENMGIIIQTVSETTGRYVEIGKDESFSIGLLAFDEAVEKYDETRGPFLPFSKMVIRSRVITYLEKENRHKHQSIDVMIEGGVQFEDVENSEEDIRSEIEDWTHILEDYEITLEELVIESPVHQQTRERAITISENSYQNNEVIDHMENKKRLPIRKVARLNKVTERIVKGSKIFITAVIIVFKNDYRLILNWVRG